MPIEDSLFEQIKRGNPVDDNKISAAEIIPFQSHQRVRIYLMSIGIDPKTRNAGQGLFQEPLEKRPYGFFNKLIDYATSRHIRVSELLAVG